MAQASITGPGFTGTWPAGTWSGRWELALHLKYVLGYGIPGELAERLASLVLSLVVASIVVHGISVTPLMKRYERQSRGEQRSAA